MYFDICFLRLHLGISPEELFFAFRDQYSGLLTKVNWGLGFDDNIKYESKKCINGKYFGRSICTPTCDVVKPFKIPKNKSQQMVKSTYRRAPAGILKYFHQS